MPASSPKSLILVPFRFDLAGGPLIGWRATREDKARFHRNQSQPRPPALAFTRRLPPRWHPYPKEPSHEPNSMPK
jgi:hypothetical protein